MKKQRRWLAAGGLTAAAALISAPAALAAPGTDYSIQASQAFATNGSVSALQADAGTLYVGGQFTRIGRPTGGGVAVNTSTGQALGAGPAIQGAVTAVTSDGKNGWFIAGNFGAVGGEAHLGLAHILADGTVDHRFKASMTGRRHVYALTVANNKLYIGGRFSDVGGKRRHNLAAVSTMSGRLLGMAPSVNGTVYGLVVRGPRLYVGGSFTRIGRVSIRGLAALNGSRVIKRFKPRVQGTVMSFGLVRTSIVIGGAFSYVGGQHRSNLAQLTLSKGRVTGWKPALNAPATSLGFKGSQVIVGGSFTRVNSTSRHGLAAIMVPSGSIRAFAPTPQDGVVAPVVDRGSVVFVGNAAYSLKTGAQTGWTPAPNGPVEALAIDNRSVFVGGAFTLAGGVARSGLAAVDTAAAAVTPWAPALQGGVTALAVSGSTLYAGGPTSAADQARSGAAAFDTGSAAPTAWAPTFTGTVRAIQPDGTHVYIGGNLSYGSGSSAGAALARVDATTGASDSTWKTTLPSGGGAVNSLALAGTRLLVGGQFGALDGQPRTNLASFDTTSGALEDWAPTPTGPAVASIALASDGSRLVVSGSAGELAQYDLTNGQSVAWPAQSPSHAGEGSIAVSGDQVIVSGRGQISLITGVGAAWAPGYRSQTRNDATVNAVAVIGRRVYVGGSFASVGPTYSPNLAGIDDPYLP